MSGGSFDYLYTAEITSRLYDIEGMATALDELGEFEAARRTRVCLDYLKAATVVQEELSAVWRAVEWFHSADISQESALKIIAEWKAKAGRAGV